MIRLISVSRASPETRQIVTLASQLFIQTVQIVHEVERSDASRRRLLAWVNSLTKANCSWVDYRLGMMLEILLKACGEPVLAHSARRGRRLPEKPIFIDVAFELLASVDDKIVDLALAAWKNPALARKLRAWVATRTDQRCSWAKEYVMVGLEKELDIWCPQKSVSRQKKRGKTH